ncbi:hypothetical protein [Mitsuaria sp. GD03876]|uniref:hypothetical protein n=1 Tax=Mitsuaria sp. GD03876 TaxID=2975399 RepID=UPI0024473227|nr:hypothetical protein [Mitsuaria sp. GD03876]MDH0863455.1 hypothetical protein [Mitsuaria sp. GD03876]
MSALLKEVVGTDAMAGAPVDDRLPVVAPGAWSDGVDTLVHLLRHPELAHTWPLCDLPVDNTEPVDWRRIAQQFNDFFEQRQLRCVETYVRVRMAMAVLTLNDVSLCRGPVEIRFWEDECCSPNITLELTIDANSYRTSQLNEDLGRLICACHFPGCGVIVHYRSAHPHDPADWPPRRPWLEGDEDDEA